MNRLTRRQTHMADELRYDGKVVIITGAGAGLGRSHALLFAKRGAKVVVNDLGGSHTGSGKSSAAADKVVAEIKEAGGTAVANYDSVEDGDKIVKTAVDAFGRVDVVINNAGILRDTTFHKMSKDDWDLIYKVHLLGAFRVTHAAWPLMRDQGYGRVVFTTSAAGLYGNFGQANYSAAKLALVGLTQTLALEGDKKNVRCNVIAPIAGSRMTETVLPKELIDALKPEYVSPLVAWLAHDSCTENGGIFEVGGGYFGKLRWERTEGRLFKLGREISPEHIQNNWQKITSFEKSTHPANVTESLTPVLSNSTTKSLGGNEFIDVDQALGYQMEGIESSYDERDMTLYALGVGAGQKPTDERDLHLTYERNSDGFWTLPTYGVIPAINSILKMAMEGKAAPGLNYGLDRILHGEQYTEVLAPLPPKANLKHKAKISEIWDKGKHAVVVTHIDTYDSDTGALLVKNDVSMVVRGAGGWGGERGPATDVNVAPDRAPDAVVTEKTSDSQALLYRLSGDWNPLHVDPQFATMFGFDKPILHGLCTFGYVGRAVINSFLDGDPRKFKSIKVRFADSVFPGETIRTEMWKEKDGRILLRATAVERNKVVISNAAVELYPEIPVAKAPEAAKAAASTGGASQTQLIFNAITAHVAANADEIKKIGTVYQFKLKSPDSAWVIDTKEGKVSQGTAAKADCTLELTDADWLDMTSGKADPQKLFSTGKLKITGNVMASQKLSFLKKIDRPSTGSGPAAAAPAAAPAGGYGTRDVFGAIAGYVAANAADVKKIGVVYQFKVKNPDSAWVIDTKEGKVSEGTVPKADCTLELTDADWLDMTSGKADPQKLFSTGKLKISGNVMASQKLDFLKKIDRTSAGSVQATAAVASAAPAPSSSSAPASGPNAQKIFAALTERLQKNPQLAKEVDAKLTVKVKNPDASQTFELGKGNTTITISDEDLTALAKGERTAKDLYMNGLMRVDGDVAVAHRLGIFNKLF
ncbi:MAG: SDR family NAD(P)-dependent oxidoreductase [Myxococcaceae bacterium]|nr:SDR family NAD(P)-dependent oxidoreductase [Myxococcaceae bacterium]